MGGDFNGHIQLGNEHYERMHGGWGFSNPNVEGDRLLQFALSLNLTIINTRFEKRDGHVIIYKSVYRIHIDYFYLDK